MSQFFFLSAFTMHEGFQTQRLYGWSLGMQFPGAVIGGPTCHPTTMWLSKQAGTAGPELLRTPRDGQGVRVVGQALQALVHGPASVGRSRLVDPEGAGVERWDGKSGHGAESVRHAEMSLAATGESIGPVRDLSVPGFLR